MTSYKISMQMEGEAVKTFYYDSETDKYDQFESGLELLDAVEILRSLKISCQWLARNGAIQIRLEEQ